MSRKIIGVTVGTPLSIRAIKDKLNPVTQVNGVEADKDGNVKTPTVPTKLSEFQNDAGYAKTSDVNDLIAAAITGAIGGSY